MNIIPCSIPGLLKIELKVFSDTRGFFIERFRENAFRDAGLPSHFPQMNHSRSRPKVLRGLHLQHTPPQGKCVGVTNGAIWDVAVDLRPGSKTFGQYEAIELSGKNATMLWIPPGFAHGFCVLGDEDADVIYHVTEYYQPGGEVGIHWNDPDLNIAWPIKNPIISERDQNLPGFKEYRSNFDNSIIR